MTDKEKTQIELLRTSGYSYGQIAELLNLPKSSVSNYCLNNKIKKPDPPGIRPLYRCCLRCRKLFVLTSRHQRQFCSDKCRAEYWKKEKATEKAVKEAEEKHMTLKEVLDFLPEERDELDGDGALLIGYYSQTTNTT